MTDQTSNTGLRYRQMSVHDLPSAHALSQSVRWSHRIEDWQFVHRLGGGFVAEENGALVGIALCWVYGQAHASLGMIIVSPEQQGKGIGRVLMNLLLEKLGDRSILLNATAAGQPLYEKLGFMPIGNTHQHQGMMRPLVATPLGTGERIRPILASDTKPLAELAARAVGMPRTEVMTQLLSVADSAVVIEADGELTGFSVMRRFGRGHQIGPVVAANTECAKALIAHWATAYAGSFVRVDVTAESGLSPWLAELGLAQVDTVVVMVRGDMPAPDASVRQYAILNQAIG